MRAALCLATFFVIYFMAAAAFAAPSLQVNDSSFDFGTILQGEKVPHVFEFVNQGDEALYIDRVQSSCGCTAVLVSEKNIPVKGKGEIRANFDSSRFRGAVTKTIYVYSNDPINPVLQLQIKGTVLETVAIEPAQINFGDVVAGKTVTSTVLLRNQSGKELTLGKPHATAEELVVKALGSSFADGEEVTLEIRLKPKPGQARFSGYVLVPVAGVSGNELRIPVYGTLK